MISIKSGTNRSDEFAAKAAHSLSSLCCVRSRSPHPTFNSRSHNQFEHRQPKLFAMCSPFSCCVTLSRSLAACKVGVSFCVSPVRAPRVHSSSCSAFAGAVSSGGPTSHALPASLRADALRSASLASLRSLTAREIRFPHPVAV